jgi:hypothetical protein
VGGNVKILKSLFIHSFMTNPEVSTRDTLLICGFMCGLVKLKFKEFDRLFELSAHKLNTLAVAGFRTQPLALGIAGLS